MFYVYNNTNKFHNTSENQDDAYRICDDDDDDDDFMIL